MLGRYSLALVFVLTVGMTVGCSATAAWKPADGPLMTPFAKDVSPANALPEHPRPQMVREAWQNLNGLWDYAIVAKDAPQPEEYDGQILVPYAVESALSGVMQTVGPEKCVWYHRTFKTPHLDGGKRLLLHFEGVDWDATVYLNGHPRRHRCAPQGLQRPPRPRLRPDRQGQPAARQAGPEAARHLVHRGHRHLGPCRRPTSPGSS